MTAADGAAYDAIATSYARHWGPVIRPGAERVLDLAAPAVTSAIDSAPSAHLLDVGTGTGALAIAALERWPELEVTGIDPSSGMLEVARRIAGERLPPELAERYRTSVAWADELPFDDASFDVAVSSFVLQLVPNRAAVLREVRRVLRPGGTLAWVSWLRGGDPYEPDRIANEVLDEAGFDPPEPGAGHDDLASTASAAATMRRAGFRAVRAVEDAVVHQWDPAGYVAFFTEFDEGSLFAELDPRERADIERELRRRLDALDAAQMTLRMPVVRVIGRSPG